MELSGESWVVVTTDARPELEGRGDPRPGVEIMRGSDEVADSAGPWLRSWEEVHGFVADVLGAAAEAFGHEESR